MTGFAFPEMMRDAHVAGCPGQAADRFDAYLSLARYEQQLRVGLAVRKHMLARHGAIPSPAMRRPAVRPCADFLAGAAFLLARLATLAPRALTMERVAR